MLYINKDIIKRVIKKETYYKRAITILQWVVDNDKIKELQQFIKINNIDSLSGLVCFLNNIKE